MQPMHREPILPPLPAPEPEAALFPDETEIRLVREDKSHEVHSPQAFCSSHRTTYKTSDVLHGSIAQQSHCMLKY